MKIRCLRIRRWCIWQVCLGPVGRWRIVSSLESLVSRTFTTPRERERERDGGREASKAAIRKRGSSFGRKKCPSPMPPSTPTNHPTNQPVSGIASNPRGRGSVQLASIHHRRILEQSQKSKRGDQTAHASNNS